MSTSSLSSARSSITPPPGGLTGQRPQSLTRSTQLSEERSQQIPDEVRATRGMQVYIRPHDETLKKAWPSILKQGRMLLVVRVPAGNKRTGRTSIWCLYDVLHKAGDSSTIVTVPADTPGYANLHAKIRQNEQSFLDGGLLVKVPALRSSRTPKSACLYTYSMSAKDYAVTIARPKLPDIAAESNATGTSSRARARSPSPVRTTVGCYVQAKKDGGNLADLLKNRGKPIFIMLEDRHQAFVFKGSTATQGMITLERRLCPVPNGLVRYAGAVNIYFSGVQDSSPMPAFVYR